MKKKTHWFRNRDNILDGGMATSQEQSGTEKVRGCDSPLWHRFTFHKGWRCCPIAHGRWPFESKRFSMRLHVVRTRIVSMELSWFQPQNVQWQKKRNNVFWMSTNKYAHALSRRWKQRKLLQSHLVAWPWNHAIYTRTVVSQMWWNQGQWTIWSHHISKIRKILSTLKST